MKSYKHLLSRQNYFENTTCKIMASTWLILETNGDDQELLQRSYIHSRYQCGQSMNSARNYYSFGKATIFYCMLQVHFFFIFSLVSVAEWLRY